MRCRALNWWGSVSFAGSSGEYCAMAALPLMGSFGRTGEGDANMMKIFSTYAGVVKSNESPSKKKERLSALSKYADSEGLTGQAAFSGLRSVCSRLQAKFQADSGYFALFYHFVFFMCREPGQKKSIAKSAAVEGWRIALKGRFRLLDHWCPFVEGYQRYAISEDTWVQVLQFCRSVPENLSDFDPEGAWPVLVDEFVDSMYRKNACTRCKDTYSVCDCGVDAMPMLNTGDPSGSSSNPRPGMLPGMAAQAGSKRRLKDPIEEAPQAESVNSSSQRLAGMASPLMIKRFRARGSANSEAADPMEVVDGDSQNPQGSTTSL